MQLTIWIWLGIAAAVAHAAMFSGLNLGVFSVSRLRLELEAATGNESATMVQQLRQDDVILLWGPRKRIVTGADLLGRLLRGIARRQAA